MFETFISAGKSGSVSKSITEALSRVISLALRGGINIEDIIKTLNNISGSEAWVYDSYNNGEIIVKSIPDVTSKMLKDIIEYYKDICINFNFPDIQEEEEKHVLNKTEVNEDACPECGASMVMVSGCKICYQCGFSPCK